MSKTIAIKMIGISVFISLISFAVIFASFTTPEILEPGVSAEETEGMNDEELLIFYESRTKNIGYVRMFFFLADYQESRLRGVLLFLGLFIMSFVSQLLCWQSLKRNNIETDL